MAQRNIPLLKLFRKPYFGHETHI